MKRKIYNNLLLFSLIGISQWFFGNLYEAAVIVPNLLKDPVSKIENWRHFFIVTNPIIFYIPISPLALLALFFIYFKTRRLNIPANRFLRNASLAGLLAFIIGFYIISQINLKLFFGPIEKNSKEIYKLSVMWNILNGIRVILLAITIYNIFKAYIEKFKQ